MKITDVENEIHAMPQGPHPQIDPNFINFVYYVSNLLLPNGGHDFFGSMLKQKSKVDDQICNLTSYVFYLASNS